MGCVLSRNGALPALVRIPVVQPVTEQNRHKYRVELTGQAAADDCAVPAKRNKRVAGGRAAGGLERARVLPWIPLLSGRHEQATQ